MNENFTAAIFDMDGTLLDTMPYWRYTSVEYLLAHRLPLLKDIVAQAFDVSSRKLIMDNLKGDGVKLCVATGSPRQYARNGLRRLGILPYFEFVTDNYEGKYAKHQPEYFLDLAKRLDAEPGACWVFEDALYAMKAAKAAGMRVCAIEDATQRTDREAIRALADRYILSYADLLGTVG